MIEQYPLPTSAITIIISEKAIPNFLGHN